MAIERTFSIIKPDAVRAGNAGHILQHLIDGGLRPVAMRMMRLTRAQAEGFYAVHRERPFFKDLVETPSTNKTIGISERHRAIQLGWHHQALGFRWL